MALYENNVTLKGYLGKDAETIATKQQRTFAVLSLATKSGYKDKQTQRVGEPHRVAPHRRLRQARRLREEPEEGRLRGGRRRAAQHRVRRGSRRGQEEDHGQAPRLGDTRQHRQQAGAA